MLKVEEMPAFDRAIHWCLESCLLVPNAPQGFPSRENQRTRVDFQNAIDVDLRCRRHQTIALWRTSFLQGVHRGLLYFLTRKNSRWTGCGKSISNSAASKTEQVCCANSLRSDTPSLHRIGFGMMSLWSCGRDSPLVGFDAQKTGSKTGSSGSKSANFKTSAAVSSAGHLKFSTLGNP